MLIKFNFFLLNSALMFLISCLVFIFNRKYLLITLLSLEYIMLNLFFFQFIVYSMDNFEIYFLMVFLIFGACEGCLGLSLLIKMMRTHGNNYFQSFSLLMC